MKQITEFEIIDHGIEHEQYFQGCGCAFTRFDECHTGIGDNPHEALEDALECAAQCDWDVSIINNNMKHKPRVSSKLDEHHYYVSIRLKEQRFTVIEYSSFFAVRDNRTGKEQPMGDGVDSLFDDEGKALSPGTTGFTEAWTQACNENQDETLNGYFPEQWEKENCNG